jgi:2,3-dihydroxybiphenyl 1,2-dioxygenase
MDGAMTTDVRLGYLTIEARDLDAWEGFAVDVLGLEARREEGALVLRCDEWAQRFVVSAGPADDVTAIGWEVDADALDAVTARLRAAGVDVAAGTDAEARARRVAGLVKLRDPNGTPLEICFGPELAAAPFRSRHLVSSFITGRQGLGHVVVGARDAAESQRFYCDLLGFRVSDRIVCEVYGYPVDITFLHASARHHTVAIGAVQPKRIHHFLLEAASMDDVGLAFDRAMRAGVRIIQTLGRHPNDRMFSFYGKTPSGFEFEFGWGARQVDDATWQPTTHHRISEWGHHPPQAFAPRRAATTENNHERTTGAGGEVRRDR